MRPVRTMLCGALVLAALMPATGCVWRKGDTVERTERAEQVTKPAEAYDLLDEGNEAFVAEEYADKDLSEKKREALAEGQKPFAVVVTCSDSRVAPEYFFDQGIGDLFVVRTAGNVIDPVALGSIEYAVEHLKVPLVIVVGHTACGAVKATFEGGEAPGSIGSIVEAIAPSVAAAKASAGGNEERAIELATESNVREMMRRITKSPVIEEAGWSEVSVKGAIYDIATGEVKSVY